MAKSLQEFLNYATSSTIRSTNTFECYITTGYSELDKVLENVTLFGQNFSIPDRTINYANVSFKGYEMQNLVPTNMAMTQEHTMTVIADVNGELRRAFLAWQGKVMNPAISDGSLFEGDRGVNPKSAVRIHLFDKDNKTVVEIYKLYNVVCSGVGAMEFNHEGGDKSTFEVTLKSTYWEIEKSDKGALIGQR